MPVGRGRRDLYGANSFAADGKYKYYSGGVLVTKPNNIIGNIAERWTAPLFCRYLLVWVNKAYSL